MDWERIENEINLQALTYFNDSSYNTSSNVPIIPSFLSNDSNSNNLNLSNQLNHHINHSNHINNNNYSNNQSSYQYNNKSNEFNDNNSNSYLNTNNNINNHMISIKELSDIKRSLNQTNKHLNKYDTLIISIQSDVEDLLNKHHVLNDNYIDIHKDYKNILKLSNYLKKEKLNDEIIYKSLIDRVDNLEECLRINDEQYATKEVVNNVLQSTTDQMKLIHSRLNSVSNNYSAKSDRLTEQMLKFDSSLRDNTTQLNNLDIETRGWKDQLSTDFISFREMFAVFQSDIKNIRHTQTSYRGLVDTVVITQSQQNDQIYSLTSQVNSLLTKESQYDIKLKSLERLINELITRESVGNTIDNKVNELSTTLTNNLTTSLTNSLNTVQSTLDSKFNQITNNLSTHTTNYNKLLDITNQLDKQIHELTNTTDSKIDKNYLSIHQTKNELIELISKLTNNVTIDIHTKIDKENSHLKSLIDNKIDIKLANKLDNELYSKIDSKIIDKFDTEINNTIDSKIDSKVIKLTNDINYLSNQLTTTTNTSNNVANNLTNRLDRLNDELVKQVDIIVQSTIPSIRQDIHDLKNTASSSNDNIKQLDSDINLLKNIIYGSSNSAVDSTNRLDRFDFSIESFRKALDALQEELLNISELLDKVNENVVQINDEKNKSSSKFTNNISEVEEKILRLQEKVLHMQESISKGMPNLPNPWQQSTNISSTNTSTNVTNTNTANSSNYLLRSIGPSVPPVPISEIIRPTAMISPRTENSAFTITTPRTAVTTPRTTGTTPKTTPRSNTLTNNDNEFQLSPSNKSITKISPTNSSLKLVFTQADISSTDALSYSKSPSEDGPETENESEVRIIDNKSKLSLDLPSSNSNSSYNPRGAMSPNSPKTSTDFDLTRRMSPLQQGYGLGGKGLGSNISSLMTRSTRTPTPISPPSYHSMNPADNTGLGNNSNYNSYNNSINNIDNLNSNNSKSNSENLINSSNDLSAAQSVKPNVVNTSINKSQTLSKNQEEDSHSETSTNTSKSKAKLKQSIEQSFDLSNSFDDSIEEDQNEDSNNVYTEESHIDDEDEYDESYESIDNDNTRPSNILQSEINKQTNYLPSHTQLKPLQPISQGSLNPISNVNIPMYPLASNHSFFSTPTISQNLNLLNINNDNTHDKVPSSIFNSRSTSPNNNSNSSNSSYPIGTILSSNSKTNTGTTSNVKPNSSSSEITAVGLRKDTTGNKKLSLISPQQSTFSEDSPRNVSTPVISPRLSSHSYKDNSFHDTAQCPHCLKRFNKNDMQNHIKICDVRIEACRYGCGTRLFWKKLDQHYPSCTMNPMLPINTSTSYMANRSDTSKSNNNIGKIVKYNDDDIETFDNDFDIEED